MPLLIGVDEAGYGPNFGPLVIAATGWLVPAGVTHEGLATTLSTLITTAPASRDDGRLWIADSKKVYRAGQGFSALERGVLCMLSAGRGTEPDGPLSPSDSAWPRGERWPRTLRDLWQRYDATYHVDAARVPWFADVPVTIPVDTREELIGRSRDFWSGWSPQPVRYLGPRITIVVARRFNALLRRYGTKSSLLTHVTLQLVKRCLHEWAGHDPWIDIVCDKHGGRNRYAAMLQDGQTDALVTVQQETRAISHYCWREVLREVHWRFVMESERWLPSALASMTAKYVRELSMKSFNAYWARHAPGVRKTAGYPTDARRFRREIAAAQQRLGLPDNWLWRSK